MVSSAMPSAVVKIWAPAMFALLAVDGRGEIVPSPAALAARQAGLEIVTWSLERSGTLHAGNNGFYYQTINPAITGESDVLRVLDVLAEATNVIADCLGQAGRGHADQVHVVLAHDV